MKRDAHFPRGRVHWHFQGYLPLGRGIKTQGLLQLPTKYRILFSTASSENMVKRALCIGVSYNDTFAEHPAYTLPSTLPDVDHFSNLLISTFHVHAIKAWPEAAVRSRPIWICIGRCEGHEGRW